MQAPVNHREWLIIDIKTAVKNHHDGLPETCEASGCPRRAFAGFLVRWLGHDIMGFRAPKTMAEPMGALTPSTHAAGKKEISKDFHRAWPHGFGAT